MSDIKDIMGVARSKEALPFEAETPAKPKASLQPACLLLAASIGQIWAPGPEACWQGMASCTVPASSCSLALSLHCCMQLQA